MQERKAASFKLLACGPPPPPGSAGPIRGLYKAVFLPPPSNWVTFIALCTGLCKASHLLSGCISAIAHHQYYGAVGEWHTACERQAVAVVDITQPIEEAIRGGPDDT